MLRHFFFSLLPDGACLLSGTACEWRPARSVLPELLDGRRNFPWQRIRRVLSSNDTSAVHNADRLQSTAVVGTGRKTLRVVNISFFFSRHSFFFVLLLLGGSLGKVRQHGSRHSLLSKSITSHSHRRCNSKSWSRSRVSGRVRFRYVSSPT